MWFALRKPGRYQRPSTGGCLEILERRQVAEVRPIELEGDAATAVAEPEIEDTLLELDEDIDPDILDQLTASQWRVRGRRGRLNYDLRGFHDCPDYLTV